MRTNPRWIVASFGAALLAAVTTAQEPGVKVIEISPTPKAEKAEPPTEKPVEFRIVRTQDAPKAKGEAGATKKDAPKAIVIESDVEEGPAKGEAPKPSRFKVKKKAASGETTIERAPEHEVRVEIKDGFVYIDGEKAAELPKGVDGKGAVKIVKSRKIAKGDAKPGDADGGCEVECEVVEGPCEIDGACESFEGPVEVFEFDRVMGDETGAFGVNFGDVATIVRSLEVDHGCCDDACCSCACACCKKSGDKAKGQAKIQIERATPGAPGRDGAPRLRGALEPFVRRYRAAAPEFKGAWVEMSDVLEDRREEILEKLEKMRGAISRDAREEAIHLLDRLRAQLHEGRDADRREFRIESAGPKATRQVPPPAPPKPPQAPKPPRARTFTTFGAADGIHTFEAPAAPHHEAGSDKKLRAELDELRAAIKELREEMRSALKKDR
jgi:hypothetical protein